MPRMTLGEFLQWDDGSDRRHQLVDGLPIERVQLSEAHGELAAALAAEVRDQLWPPHRLIGRACIVAHDRADTCYLADLGVTRARRASRAGR